MTKRIKFYLIINVILLIIFSLSLVMGKIFNNPNTAPSSSYVFGLFAGYLTATVACILDRKLKDETFKDKFEDRSGKAEEIVIDSKCKPLNPSNIKNDIKNMIVFDPKGEPYNGFIKKIIINKEKKEQLKAMVNAAVYIDNYYSKFIRNVFRDAHNNFKKGLFRQINIIDISDYNFLFYVSDCLHNVPEIIMASLRLIDCEENEIIDIPFIYLLLQREIQCLKNIINTDDDRTRKEMKIKDNIHILYYIQELIRMDEAIDDLLLNIQKFMEGEGL